MMTNWHHGRMAAFDTETSGVSVFEDRIVSAHIAHVGGNEPTTSHSWLLNPGIEISAEAIAVHHITNEQARTGQDAATGVEAIAAELCRAMAGGVPIVGWNVVFDLSLLASELARYNLTPMDERLGHPVSPVVDGLLLDKAVDKYRKGSRKLVDVAIHYDVELLEADAHGAAADAMAAARVVYKIACRYPDVLGEMTLAELHNEQIEWAAQNAKSFRAYLKKQGKPYDDVSGDWPVRVAAQVPA